MLVDGSFVTHKPERNDIDSVILLPIDFKDQIDRAVEAALELESMIMTLGEYEKAQEELRLLEERLGRIQEAHPVGSKGFTKAGIRKMIARLHEELAIFEGSQEARQGIPT